ncbi:MAG: shikimate dehydrogenase [Gammaproteobacteria bacterium]|nr:shikimate dehydrogenase [Gammaproteobacteria bacterium]
MAAKGTKPDRYAVVGHPVDHSRSPLIHQLFARQTGENITYELIDASPEEFEVAVRGFAAAGGKGLNITSPHKQAAFEISTERGHAADRAGAVNTLTFLPGGAIRGDNTDGMGFILDLTANHEQDINAKRILVLGAGGATRGILAPLLEAEPAELVLANRTLERAAALVEQFQSSGKLTACRFTDLDDLAPFDLVVNATSAGTHGETPPFPPSCVGSVSFCYDLAYALKGTPFVAWARKHGARKAVQGWGMLVEQAAESYQIWRGMRPDTEHILKKLVF